jgi:hypothetical protein
MIAIYTTTDRPALQCVLEWEMQLQAYVQGNCTEYVQHYVLFAVRVEFVVNKVAVGQDFLRLFALHLSVSFHRCSATWKTETETNPC